MRAEITSFWDWQQRFSDEKSCLDALVKRRWPDGFRCPCCGHQKGWLPQARHAYECADCHHHTSVTAGALFHNTKLPPVKWFWSLYWVSSDKGGISALRLAKLIGVSWVTAHRMLRKLRTATGDQDNLYKLSGIIEFDGAFIGGKRAGKRGRGATGKTAVLVACGHNDGKPGFVAMKVVERVTHESARAFAQQTLAPGQTLHTDALAALNVLAEEHHHIAKVTPPEMASGWLPWVQVVTSNLKSYPLGTYHGLSGRYVQECLDEFCYRLNRRFWEHQIPNRLLKLCANHKPVFLQPATCS